MAIRYGSQQHYSQLRWKHLRVRRDEIYVLLKTYKFRIYDMFHFSESRVRLMRCGIQKNFLLECQVFRLFF